MADSRVFEKILALGVAALGISSAMAKRQPSSAFEGARAERKPRESFAERKARIMHMRELKKKGLPNPYREAHKAKVAARTPRKLSDEKLRDLIEEMEVIASKANVPQVSIGEYDEEDSELPVCVPALKGAIEDKYGDEVRIHTSVQKPRVGKHKGHEIGVLELRDRDSGAILYRRKGVDWSILFCRAALDVRQDKGELLNVIDTPEDVTDI